MHRWLPSRQRRTSSDEPQAPSRTSLRLCTPKRPKSRANCHSSTRTVVWPCARRAAQRTGACQRHTSLWSFYCSFQCHYAVEGATAHDMSLSLDRHALVFSVSPACLSCQYVPSRSLAAVPLSLLRRTCSAASPLLLDRPVLHTGLSSTLPKADSLSLVSWTVIANPSLNWLLSLIGRTITPSPATCKLCPRHRLR
ncbi:hypothetical protein CC86DRAFT_201600 [Ophiobolus disseminans]|uniref:Uncharacterized protein n=1 Tax=Ophiobolus disseminans TaxID=1469910 RepID=A0A6A7A3L6_9PLEO|nr:hypothetical protein CC86DRAFT_201600 [Ophiobolus disseminans]